jgi:hypothetical protein
LAQAGKAGNIQIDSDEYCLKVLLILKQNKHYLNNPEQQPVEIQQWITLFKSRRRFLRKDSLDTIEVAPIA